MTYANLQSVQPKFTALADPTRRTVFEIVAKGPHPVTRIAAQLSVSRPAVSQHLKVLMDAGLVTRRPSGRNNIYQAEPASIADLRQYLDTLWSEVLSRFEAEMMKDGKDA
ncbi:MAG: metalloregulator ArsR/SmtB family transcription factor [Pseudomonadota bacterium]